MMRVAVVSHEASRTGAPRIAVLVARTLVEQGHTVNVVSRTAGPLVPDFKAVAPTRVQPLRRVRSRLWNLRGLSAVAYVLDTALATVSLLVRRPDLVYVNSSAASIYIRPALWLRRRIVLHVHESRGIASGFLTQTKSMALLPKVTLVACSPSVQCDLGRLAGVPEEQVLLLPSVPDDEEVMRKSRMQPDHDYQPEDLIVGCCGSAEQRKGVDLWMQAAEKVRQALPGHRVRFVWVGEVDRAIATSAPQGVDFVGPTPNPYAHMRRFDVATLPSRDDPFPLVVLEAMLAGTPVVAFGVGGVPTQIGDAGVVVTPGDVEAFARQVARLLAAPDERIRLGRDAEVRARSLFSTRGFAESLSEIVADPVRQASAAAG